MTGGPIIQSDDGNASTQLDESSDAELVTNALISTALEETTSTIRASANTQAINAVSDENALPTVPVVFILFIC